LDIIEEIEKVVNETEITKLLIKLGKIQSHASESDIHFEKNQVKPLEKLHKNLYSLSK